MDLGALGFDQWFKDQQDKLFDEGFEVARITEVNRNSYIVKGFDAESYAELAGSTFFTTNSSMDFPSVGDWVQVKYHNDGAHAIIYRIYKRKSLLRRKMAGKTIDYQLIAANIDIAFIVQSCDFDFNIRRLERYLAMVNEGNIDPVLVLTKTDMVCAEDLEEIISLINNMHVKLNIIPVSNVTGAGLDKIKKLLTPGKTCCLIGSSGVGKTTLINKLIGEDEFETGEVRVRDGRGKHITTRRQLIVLPNGSMLIDTPGMRELGTIGFKTGIETSFIDIIELSNKCRFNNCTHKTEAGCAVLQAIENGELDKDRYNSFIKLAKESEYYQMSYAEKRSKDKKFGKFIKKAKKDPKRI